MTTPTTNRRALLVGIAAAPAALAFAAIPAAATTIVDGGRWHALKVRYDAAKAHHDMVSAAHDAAFATYEAEVAAIPHRTTTGSFASVMDGSPVHMATDNPVHVVSVMSPSVRELEGRSVLDDWSECRSELRALIAERKQAKEAIGQRTRIDWQIAQADAAYDAFCEARDALLLEPAPDADAALFKLGYLLKPEWEGDDLPHMDEAVAAQLLADVRRLLGGEA